MVRTVKLKQENDSETGNMLSYLIECIYQKYDPDKDATEEWLKVNGEFKIQYSEDELDTELKDNEWEYWLIAANWFSSMYLEESRKYAPLVRELIIDPENTYIEDLNEIEMINQYPYYDPPDYLDENNPYASKWEERVILKGKISMMDLIDAFFRIKLFKFQYDLDHFDGYCVVKTDGDKMFIEAEVI